MVQRRQFVGLCALQVFFLFSSAKDIEVTWTPEGVRSLTHIDASTEDSLVGVQASHEMNGQPTEARFPTLKS